MYSNEQVAVATKELMKEMEQHINIMENEMKRPEPNLVVVSNALGKLSKIYILVCNFTGVFSNRDFRVGGFKDSVMDLQPANPSEYFKEEE